MSDFYEAFKALDAMVDKCENNDPNGPAMISPAMLEAMVAKIAIITANEDNPKAFLKAIQADLKRRVREVQVEKMQRQKEREHASPKMN
jgi:hypothetical protein